MTAAAQSSTPPTGNPWSGRWRVSTAISSASWLESMAPPLERPTNVL